MTALLISSESLRNPVDVAELVVMDRDLTFDRLDDGELLAEVNGAWSNYRMWFGWQEDLGGMSLSCSFETKLPKPSLPRVYALLALANDKMWLGHFAVSLEENTVSFRHSIYTGENGGVSTEQVKALLDIAVQECERFFPAFQAVVWGGKSPAEAIEMALFETVAEA